MNFGECGICDQGENKGNACTCDEPASSCNSELLSRVEILLPKITDELWEMFGETQLMTWDRENNRPHWTQDAVDITAYLETRERPAR